MKKTVCGAGILVLLLSTVSVAYADCLNPARSEGTILYNEDENVPQACVGANWVPLGALNPGAGGGSCSNPNREEGAIVYNVTHKALQYCNGTDWIGIAAATIDQSHLGYDCPAGASDGLIAHWTFDETSGTTANDSVGSNDGTLNGGPVWQPTGGMIGGALQFDEVNDYVVIPDIDYGGDFTITFWYKLADNAGTQSQYLYSHGTVNANNSVNIYCIESGNGTDPNYLYGNTRSSNGAPGGSMKDAGACNNTNWNMVAVVPAGTASNDYHYLYGNGSLQYTWYSASSGTVPNPTGSIYIGGRYDQDSVRFFGGMIDDVRIYNRRLGSYELASLYFAGTACSVN